MVRITYLMMTERKIKIPEIARLSSKGQVVIPKVIRDALKLEPGMPLAVDMSRGMIIMKPIRGPIEDEDFRVLEEISKAWDEIERGEYRRAKVEDFLREIKKW
ncbi:AbrB/MazE/SpoVT family DNA-binding domain-containing protein [Candidatus Pyrohabitans sp.]